jgi:hypothetical protein
LFIKNIQINQRLSKIKLEEKPRVIRRHSLPSILNNKNSLLCSKFVIKESSERFQEIKIDLVEDYFRNRNSLQIDDEILE